MIAVDADAVNLAYIRRSLEKNLLWGNGGVSLIHNAVRWLFFAKDLNRFICNNLKIAATGEVFYTGSTTGLSQTLQQLKWWTRMNWKRWQGHKSGRQGRVKG